MDSSTSHMTSLSNILLSKVETPDLRIRYVQSYLIKNDVNIHLYETHWSKLFPIYIGGQTYSQAL